MAEYIDYDPCDEGRYPSQDGHLNVAGVIDAEPIDKAAYFNGIEDKPTKVDDILGAYAAGDIAKQEDLPKPELPAAPTSAGDYNLQCTVDAEGKATYSWEAATPSS